MKSRMSEPLWTSQAVTEATGGKITGKWNVNGISIDSRRCQAGDLFFALSGPHHDGHDFVDAAISAGAVGAVVEHLVDGIAPGQQIIVDNVKEALWNLGKAARARVNCPIIAITGSAGKTGTKEALMEVLDRQGRAHASKKSYNNDIGVPLSLARMPENVDFSIFELGMNHAGELRALTKLVRPHVAIVTMVASAHREFFDHEEDIADAKAEIFEGLEGPAVAILNRDNRHYERLRDHAVAAGAEKIVAFGEHQDAQIRPLRTALGDTCSCIVADVQDVQLTYKIGMVGHHWILNSLAVLAAVKVLGADLGLAGLALAELSPLKGRGQRHRLYLDDGSMDSILLIDESYNANPASMKAAISALQHQPIEGRGRRIAVLGQMVELGENAPQFHADLLAPLRDAHLDQVYLYGKDMKYLFERLPSRMRGGYFTDLEALQVALHEDLRDGDVVMVKGSNASGMSRIVDYLLDRDRSTVDIAANG